MHKKLTMIPGELAGIYYFPHENPIPFVLPPSFNTNIMDDISNTNIQSFHANFNNNNVNIPSNFQYLTATTTTTPCPSSNASSTSDEAEEEQQLIRIIDERRQRRMISNRESARRSRMRKQKHLDELWSQVIRLRTENHSLIDKLNHVSECHEQVLQENARLKEEVSDLRQMLSDLKIGSPFGTTPAADHLIGSNIDHHDHFDDDDDDHDRVIIPCNAAHLRAE